jgi:hypothetical protein
MSPEYTVRPLRLIVEFRAEKCPPGSSVVGCVT